jgi:ABC-type Fe3+-hydroxamate transport system substrate-binding protein
LRNDAGALLDALGREHEPAAPGARIASFVPSITELICALGLAGQLIARTQFCIHPRSEVARVPAIGGTKKVGLAKLRALGPTHAILNIEENTREMESAMREFVPGVIVTYPRRPEDNFPLYRLIGGIFGRADEAESLCAELTAALARAQAIRATLPPRRVCYFIWKDPWMRAAAATYIGNLLALANLIAAPSEVDYPKVEVSTAALETTDLFLFSSEPYAFTPADLDEFAHRHRCPREKLRLVDGEYCSWYGPRAIAGVDYIGEFARLL